MKYEVKKIERKKPGGKTDTHWIVVNARGYIANGFEHPTEEKAQTHCDNVNAYCE